jgi:hypothetical protein
MTLHSVILFLHLLGVLLLFAAQGLEWICLRNLQRAATLEQFRSWAGAATVIPRFSPFSGSLIIFPGAYLATKMKVWPQGWISMALLAVIVILALGVGVSGPRVRAMIKASMQEGAVLRDLVGRAHDPVLRYSFRLRLALGLGVVYLMGSKSPMGLSLAVMGVAVAAGLLAAAKAPPTNPQGLKPSV